MCDSFTDIIGVLLLPISRPLHISNHMNIFINDLFERLIVKVYGRIQFEQYGSPSHIVFSILLICVHLIHAEGLRVVFLSTAFQNVFVILHKLSQPNHVPLDVPVLRDLGREEFQKLEKIVRRETAANQRNVAQRNAFKDFVNYFLLVEFKRHNESAQILLFFQVVDQVVQGDGFIYIVRIESLTLKQSLCQRINQQAFCCGHCKLRSIW